MQNSVALLFTDIEGSTALVQELGPSYVGVVAAHRDVVRSALKEHRGREVDTQGDAFFAVFDDDANANAAVRCALAIQRRHVDDVGGARVKVRMGLHVGAPLQHDNGYVGVDVHVAARICGAAHGGQVLLSDAARHALDENALRPVALRDMGDRRLKDLRRLQRLHQLCADDLPSTFPPMRTLDVRPHNLPALPDDLFGRATEIDRVARLMRDADDGVRLVTLLGPGGVGKTRVAVAAAKALVDDFPDGVLFVPLAAVKDGALILAELARLLGLDAGDADVGAALHAYYAHRRALLVLDNLEQIVEGAAAVVAQLLVACPKVRVIATSREALRVRAEEPVELAPLPRHDAIALFRDRARRARRGVEFNDGDNGAIAALCARLDHLPLALELAAARARLLSPSAMLANLDAAGVLSTLAGGPRDLPDRHRALRATIEWSHALLRDDERALFAALGAFAGSFTKDAAAAVADRADVFDGIAQLVDKSLVRAVDDDGDRFTMLETVRELAVEKLAASADAPAVRRRHADWFATIAERAARRSPEFDVNIDADVDDVRSALAWSLAQKQAALALRLAGAPELMWCARGRADEGIAAVRAAVAVPFDDGDEHLWLLRARAECTAGTLAYQCGRMDEARAFHDAATASCARAGGRAKWEAAFSVLCSRCCDTTKPWSPKFEEVADRFRALVAEGVPDAEAGLGLTLNCLGFSRGVDGDADGGAAILEDLLRWWTSTDAFSLRERINAVHSHSEALRRCRRFDDARRTINDGLGMSLKLGGADRSVVFFLETLAAVDVESGDAMRAARLLGMAAAFRTLSTIATPSDGLDVDAVERTARLSIGDEAFNKAFESGKLLPPEAALSST